MYQTIMGVDDISSTYTIVSKAAYLAGVEKRIFENQHEPPKLECYQALERDKNARIVRNLCMLRTAIERNFGAINAAMRYEMKNLYTLPELVPVQCLAMLENEGIRIVKANCRLSQYIVTINSHLSNRINNCRGLFPDWVKWEYLRDLFLMPDGLTEEGTRAAANEYYANKSSCPYQVYLNWPLPDCGNLFYNDRKFLALLYQVNEDRFDDLGKVTDASARTKDGIYRFLEESRQAAVVVDCENSDPYKLYAMLRSLDREALLNKIDKIILYDDVHTTRAWQVVEQFTDIPIERCLIERIKENKSLVDIRLTTGTCREYFQNGTDAFLLLSSDSDYWGMISAMPEVRFLVMVEREKCGPGIKNALDSSGIRYCYMDDFCTDGCGDMKVRTLMAEMRRELEQVLRVNVKELLYSACRSARVELSDDERRRFMDRYLRSLQLVVGEDGQASIAMAAK